MKNFLTSLLFTLCVASAVAAHKAAIAISPSLPEAARSEVKQTLLDFLLSQAAPGDAFSIMDGSSAAIVAEFAIPNTPVDTPTARLKAMREPLARLLGWFKSQTASGNAAHGQIDSPSIVSALLRVQADSLLFVGAPTYVDPQGGTHSWHQNGQHWYPSDAAFFAGASASPWHVASEDFNQLGSLKVHWWLTGMKSPLSRPYLATIERFYGCYFQLYGAQLLSFGPGKDSLVRDLFRDDLTGRAFAPDTSDTVFEMRQVGGGLRFNATPVEPKPRRVIPPPVAKPEPPKRVPTAKFTVFLLDNSGSMSGNLDEIGRRLMAQEESPENRYALIVFDNSGSIEGRTIRVFSSPADLSAAFRATTYGTGMDSTNALADGLMAARQILKDHVVSNARILIYADVMPNEAATRPATHGYRTLFTELIADGHKPIFVKCNPLLHTDWLPEGVDVIAF